MEAPEQQQRVDFRSTVLIIKWALVFNGVANFAVALALIVQSASLFYSSGGGF